MRIIRPVDPPAVPELITDLRMQGRVMIRMLAHPCHTRCAVMQVLRTALTATALHDMFTTDSIGDTHQ